MRFRATALQQILLGGVAAGGLLMPAGPAMARDNVVKYSIAAQSLGSALRDFGLQNGMTVMADAAIVRGKRTDGLNISAEPDYALRALLSGTGLTFQRDGNIFVIKPVGNVSAPVVRAAQLADNNDIIVTAQKKEERISDVPIAMSAFTADSLDEYKIEGGSELLRAVPNVSFSKNNFSMYNFSIRGIGTKAISASSDPAVAISFNNVPLARNRLFEQEFLTSRGSKCYGGRKGRCTDAMQRRAW
jgi:iron complex outermembrane recepter protein